MSAQRASSPCQITGFDAMNLAGAIEQLEPAQGALDAVRPRDVQVAKELERLSGRVAKLIGELRDLRGAQ